MPDPQGLMFTDDGKSFLLIGKATLFNWLSGGFDLRSPASPREFAANVEDSVDHIGDVLIGHRG